MTRLTSDAAEMARRGFAHTEQAADCFARLRTRVGDHQGPADADAWLDILERAADADQALLDLDDLVATGSPDVFACLARPAALRRLVLVLGASSALGAHLRVHPADTDVLLDEPTAWNSGRVRRDVLERIGVDPDDPTPLATHPDAATALRLANRRHLVRIAARDLSSVEPEALVDSIAFELAALADAVMQGALAIARAEVPGQEQTRLAIVALGKCGAQELNYLSDIDVLFVAEPASPDVPVQKALSIATRLAAATTRICSQHTAAGSIWQVDAALRPEGRAGQLVRTLDSMRAYYEQWASNWEFQAMLKARPMAGDAALGQAFCDIVGPLVWRAGERPTFIAESRAMRRRVVDLLPVKEADREIKLGAGGLRDVEFTVQLLQLVHGRADDRLRTRATLPSLARLAEYGYIGRHESLELATAYRFQRTLEHRIQLWSLRRTHLLPDDPMMLRRLSREFGFREGVEPDLTDEFHATARRVQRLHERIFYSPLLEAVARTPSTALRMTPDAARDRLRALGFADPSAALRHIEALTNGHSRTVDIQRHLLPVLLSWFAEGGNPDFALASFRQVSEDLGTTPWYLRALRDEGLTAERLARLLSSSRYVVDLLRRAPEAIQLLGDDESLRPRSREALTPLMVGAAARHEEPGEAIAAIRALRRRELFRIAAGDILGLTSLEEVGAGLSDLAGATLDAALRAVSRGVELPAMGVVAMGRWGGREMGYGSDVDAMIVLADAEPDADPAQSDADAVRRATPVVTRLRALLGAPGADPALEVDLDLRPEGRGGPMVRTLSSYVAYYQRWSSTWEAQALVRASFGAGDRAVVQRLLDAVDPLRWPAGGLTREQVTEIRKLKARMDTERVPRGTDPRRNTKLGPGGLSDVEWTAQLIQMRHAFAVPALRTTSTERALRVAADNGLLTSQDAEVLDRVWRLASRLRNAVMLARARASDAIPSDMRDLAQVAMLLGYPPGSASRLLDDYQRCARHAAKVVDRHFWE